MRGPEELIRMKDIVLDSGSSAACRWDFPPIVELTQQVPLAFFATPVTAGPDLSGLPAALRKCGFATFRYSLALPKTFDLNGMSALYEESLRDERVSAELSVLVGAEEGADGLARSFYELLRAQPPFALVLLSPSTLTTPGDLNLITCPYFVVHGLSDAYVDEMPYERLKEAIHHHQSRFGDSTTELLVPRLGRRLAGPDGRLDPRVVEEVINWLGHAAPRRREPDAA
jgi:hypothetical protein